MSEKGLLVKKIQQGAVAAKAGMMVGDVIVSYAGLPVSKMDDIRTAINQHILGTSPIDVVLHPEGSPAETRIVQCSPGLLSATLTPWPAEKGEGSAHIPKNLSQAGFDDSQKSGLPGFVSGMTYFFGFLGLVSGIWIIATLGFVDKPYSTDSDADPFWIMVGLGVIVQSFFFSAFSLVSVMTWENTFEILKKLDAEKAKGSTASAEEAGLSSREID